MGFLKARRTGSASTGTRRPLSGTVYDLNVQPSGFDGIECTFAYESLNNQYQLGVYMDGQLVSRVEPDVTSASTAGLDEGEHTLSVWPGLRAGSWPDRHGEAYGTRAWLDWPRSTDPTCFKYNVYWDEGLGTGATTLLDSVTQVTIQTLSWESGTSGSGRISVYGDYTGSSTINDQIEIIIWVDGDERIYAYTSAVGSGSGYVSTGHTITLPYGAYCTFHDDLDQYEDGTSWTVEVGPTSQYLTPSLSSGTYTFTVKASDEIGKESDPLSSRAVRIIHPPAPAQNVEITWQPLSETIMVEWTNLGSDGVNIYTNFDTITQRFVDHVITDSPHFSSAGTSGSWAFDPVGQEGTLRFYIRPWSGASERPDLTLYSFNFPPTPTDLGLELGVPTSLTGTALAASNWSLSWDYRFTPDADALYAFAIYQVDDPNTFDWTLPTYTLLVDTDPDLTDDGAYPTKRFTYPGPTPSVTNSAYFAVRAVAEDGSSSTNVDYVMVEFDTTPPTFSGSLTVVPQ